ncbi:hypothetical protein FOZ60_007526 [Perkinsus olseni]|uniref:Uncharacterized protein n=1 Tax=Perkinsus olseni TaxID=32597 RepID=A0A7J6PPH6_PEROL|nr:hypothetical protein FOZ60_007526 [Perkinsus olseni]
MTSPSLIISPCCGKRDKSIAGVRRSSSRIDRSTLHNTEQTVTSSAWKSVNSDGSAFMSSAEQHTISRQSSVEIDKDSLEDGRQEADSLIDRVIEDSLHNELENATVDDDGEFNVSIHRSRSAFSEGSLGLRMSSHESGSHLIIDSVNNGGKHR